MGGWLGQVRLVWGVGGYFYTYVLDRWTGILMYWVGELVGRWTGGRWTGRVGELGVSELGVGELGVGELGVGK